MSREPSQRLKSKDRISTEDDVRYFAELYQGQLDWTASTRKHRAGEDWTRGNDLPDGLYFYKIETSSYCRMNKMLILH